MPDEAVEFSAAQQEIAQLREAMANRAPIEQAKGMLMYLLDCDDEAAFRVLADLSMRRQVRLRGLASVIPWPSSRSARRLSLWCVRATSECS